MWGEPTDLDSKSTALVRCRRAALDCLIPFVILGSVLRDANRCRFDPRRLGDGRGHANGPGKRMSDLRLMWRNTRMIVLCAISAALYASVLVPFKVVPLIPGVTELRPANAIPIVCSFMFGPAAAWGSAIGNMIGDFFGGMGPGDLFGFFANLVFGWVPYKVWNVIAPGRSPVSRAPADIARYVIACLAGSSLCAVVVGWGENCLGL